MKIAMKNNLTLIIPEDVKKSDVGKNAPLFLFRFHDAKLFNPK